VGALVHAIGMLRSEGSLQDADWGLSTSGLTLKRLVEVYQWKETKTTRSQDVRGPAGQMVKEKTTTYSYDSVWSPNAISTASFNDRSFSNPSWSGAIQSASSSAGLPFSAESFAQRSVWLEGHESLPLAAELRKMAEADEDIAPESLPSSGSRAPVLSDGHVYASRACASQPEVGCVRLRWTHAPLEVVSILAARSRSRLALWESSQGEGYEIGKVSFGELSAAKMLSQARASNTLWTWFKRGGGALLMWIGWGLLMGPASYLASWVPILGQVVGCVLAAVALCAALAQSLTVIAVAWIAHRPLLGSMLLAVVVVVVFGGVTGLKGASRSSSSKSSKRP